MTGLERYLEYADTQMAAELIYTEYLLSKTQTQQAKRIASLEKQLDNVKRKQAACSTPWGQARLFGGRCVRYLRRKREKSQATRAQRKEARGKGSVKSVTIAIATYRQNDYLDEAVKSALAQKCSIPIEILVVVNGGNHAWKDLIEQRYADCGSVSVLFTEKKSLCRARNLAIESARTTHLMFLDDDDWLTPGFVQGLCSKSCKDADFVMGPMRAVGDEAGKYSHFNDKLLELSRTEEKGASHVTVFSNMSAKLYRLDFLRRCKPFDESLTHTEDVVFWAENYDLCRSKIPAFLSETEAYVRRVVGGSLSRPFRKDEYPFYVTDRLSILSRLEEIIFTKPGDEDYKAFLFHLVHAQQNHLFRFLEGASDEERARALEECAAYQGQLFSRGRLARRKAIAFCHNFSPSIDPSAFVASRRLSQIEELEGESLSWHVFSKDMSDVAGLDSRWDEWFTRFACEKHKKLGGKTLLGPNGQIKFGLWGRQASAEAEADVIYSRSMNAGSHIAAYLYKRDHPEVTWYAEFSDPLARTSFGTPRDMQVSPLRVTGSFYADVEQLAYEHADHVIFTNEVQKRYMLGYCSNEHAARRADERSIVMAHPPINIGWSGVLQADYKLDAEKINVGYFGSFYIRRNFDDLLALARDERFEVHLFVPKPARLADDLAKRGVTNVRVNGFLPVFEYLNLAHRMDYLFLNDMDPLDGVTPWLPSKLSDYLSVKTPVIAKCNPESPLDRYDSPLVYKTRQIDEAFLQSLVEATAARTTTNANDRA